MLNKLFIFFKNKIMPSTEDTIEDVIEPLESDITNSDLQEGVLNELDDDLSYYGLIPAELSSDDLAELDTLSGFNVEPSDRRTALLLLRSAISHKVLSEDIYKNEQVDELNKEFAIRAYSEYLELN